jgi:hypothetical protein
LPPPLEPLEGSDETGSDDETASARGDGREATRRPAAKKTAGRPPLRPRKNDARPSARGASVS